MLTPNRLLGLAMVALICSGCPAHKTATTTPSATPAAYRVAPEHEKFIVALADVKERFQTTVAKKYMEATVNATDLLDARNPLPQREKFVKTLSQDVDEILPRLDKLTAELEKLDTPADCRELRGHYLNALHLFGEETKLYVLCARMSLHSKQDDPAYLLIQKNLAAAEQSRRAEEEHFRRETLRLLGTTPSEATPSATPTAPGAAPTASATPR